MELTLVLGGDEEPWLYLPTPAGRPGWLPLLDPAERLTLIELHATSPAGEVAHPGEVPMPAAVTLGVLLADLAAELGDDFRLARVRLGLEPDPAGHPRLVLAVEGETRVRLEGGDDRLHAARLARLGGPGESQWQSVLVALRRDLRTGQYLRLTAQDDGRISAVCYRSQDDLLRGAGGEPLSLP